MFNDIYRGARGLKNVKKQYLRRYKNNKNDNVLGPLVKDTAVVLRVYLSNCYYF